MATFWSSWWEATLETGRQHAAAVYQKRELFTYIILASS